MVTACPAGTSRSPFRVASTASTASGRQRRQVRQRLVPDLAAVAVGAAQQHRLVHPPLPDFATYVRRFRLRASRRCVPS